MIDAMILGELEKLYDNSYEVVKKNKASYGWIEKDPGNPNSFRLRVKDSNSVLAYQSYFDHSGEILFDVFTVPQRFVAAICKYTDINATNITGFNIPGYGIVPRHIDYSMSRRNFDTAITVNNTSGELSFYENDGQLIQTFSGVINHTFEPNKIIHGYKSLSPETTKMLTIFHD